VRAERVGSVGGGNGDAHVAVSHHSGSSLVVLFLLQNFTGLRGQMGEDGGVEMGREGVEGRSNRGRANREVASGQVEEDDSVGGGVAEHGRGGEDGVGNAQRANVVAIIGVAVRKEKQKERREKERLG
jgi:hypothetical protein